MALGKNVGFVVFLTFLWTSTKADGVDCVLRESCILPCRFQAGVEVVIHWIQLTPRETQAHSYYHNKNQFQNQNQQFTGRTSLFKDQISKGNASLQLTGVKIQDQGRYQCYTSTIADNKESFITLNVHTPVSKVDIQQVEDRTTCSSDGIYPEPQLTWSTNPPSNITDEPAVQLTEEKLYNISSTLRDSVKDLDYSCTVSTRSSKRKATLFKPTSINGSRDGATIPCAASNTARTSLIWRFNHSHIILHRTGDADTVSEGWKQQVKSVSESGSLTLHNLSSNQEGIYTCELSDAEETNVTNTFLKIKESQDTPDVAAIAVGSVVSILVVAIIIIGLYIKYRRNRGVI